MSSLSAPNLTHMPTVSELHARGSESPIWLNDFIIAAHSTLFLRDRRNSIEVRALFMAATSDFLEVLLSISMPLHISNCFRILTDTIQCASAPSKTEGT